MVKFAKIAKMTAIIAFCQGVKGPKIGKIVVFKGVEGPKSKKIHFFFNDPKSVKKGFSGLFGPSDGFLGSLEP